MREGGREGRVRDFSFTKSFSSEKERKKEGKKKFKGSTVTEYPALGTHRESEGGRRGKPVGEKGL